MNYFDVLDRGRKIALYNYLYNQAQNLGRGAAGGESASVKTSPVPSEPIAYDIKWDFVHNENSWNDAYNRPGSPLKKYYEVHPEEDLWNTTAKRAVNFNDRHYEGTIDDEEVSCGTTWADDGVQKISVNGVDYYFEIWSYGLDSKDVDLFLDVSRTTSANKVFKITKVSFSKDCKQCWEGTINAPGAKLPWVVVDTKDQYDLSIYDGKVEFQYNGSNVYPWGDSFGKFPRGYGIASLPNALGIDPIDPVNQEATDMFNKDDLTVKGYVKLAD